MNPERQQFLNLRSKPARLTSEEAAWFLGFSVHEIPMLMAAGLLKPLGHPSDNGCKFFSQVALDELKQDPVWLAKACDAIVKYWKDRNLQRPTENIKTVKRKSGVRQGCILHGKRPSPSRPKNNPLATVKKND